MSYKFMTQDIAAPLSHMGFYVLAQMDLKTKKIIGQKARSPIQVFTHHNIKWALEEKNCLIISQKILEKLENPKFYKKIVNNSYCSLKKLQKEAKIMENLDFTCYSSRNLRQTFKDYMNFWVEAIIWGHIINMTDFYFDLLSKKIKDILGKKIKESKYKIEINKAFVILITSMKRSLLVQQEIDFLSLYKKIQDEILRRNTSFRNATENKMIKKKIVQHVKKYDWLQYHYIGPTILTCDYYLAVLENMAKQGINAKDKMQEIISREQETKKLQKKLIKKIAFSAKDLYWIKVAREFTYLKALRKEITFFASRAMDSLLKEIARKLRISLQQLQFLTSDEICQKLKRGEIFNKAWINKLNKRMEHCVGFYSGGKLKISIDQQSETIKRKIRADKIDQNNIREFKGAVAFPGKTRGIVAIIFGADDIAKMQQDNILVSPATNPNILSAIKKAAAIITDEGGIMCHAAIVAREFKIPCIVGTKIATQILKDGDLVEVDADNGAIKRLISNFNPVIE